MGNWFYVLAIFVTILLVVTTFILCLNEESELGLKIASVTLTVALLFWWWVPLRHTNEQIQHRRHARDSQSQCEKDAGRRCVFIPGGWYPTATQSSNPVRPMSWRI